MKLKIVCIIPSTVSNKVLPLLSRCINSLQISAKLGGISITTVIVADNRKYKKKSIAAKFDHLFYAGEKPGFAKVNNLAIGKTISDEFDYYLLINDDVWVEKDFFSNIKKVIHRENPDLMVPLTYEGEGPVIDSFGVEYCKSGYAKNAPNLKIKTQLCAMACLLVKRNLMLKMKNSYGYYLNETLYSYLDDVEFSIRARGLGATVFKVRDAKVHHMVSYTAGRKSKYVMYHTYKNVIWVILMTWPLKSILRHLFSILLVQGWNFIYAFKSYGPAFFFKILLETIKNLNDLLSKRRSTLASYKNNFNFESVLSKHTFRTYHNITF